MIAESGSVRTYQVGVANVDERPLQDRRVRLVRQALLPVDRDIAPPLASIGPGIVFAREVRFLQQGPQAIAQRLDARQAMSRNRMEEPVGQFVAGLRARRRRGQPITRTTAARTRAFRLASSSASRARSAFALFPPATARASASRERRATLSARVSRRRCAFTRRSPAAATGDNCISRGCNGLVRVLARHEAHAEQIRARLLQCVGAGREGHGSVVLVDDDIPLAEQRYGPVLLWPPRSQRRRGGRPGHRRWSSCWVRCS